MIAKKTEGAGRGAQMCVEGRAGEPAGPAATGRRQRGHRTALGHRDGPPNPDERRNSAHGSDSRVVPLTGSSKPGEASYLWRQKPESRVLLEMGRDQAEKGRDGCFWRNVQRASSSCGADRVGACVCRGLSNHTSRPVHLTTCDSLFKKRGKKSKPCPRTRPRLSVVPGWQPLGRPFSAAVTC